MKSLTRRIFLRASAVPAAALVSTVVTTPALPSAAPEKIENPALVALLPEVEKVEAAVAASKEAMAAAEKKLRETFPEPHRSLIVTQRSPWWKGDLATPERDYHRALIWPDEGKPPRRIVNAQKIRDRWFSLDLHGRKLKKYTATDAGKVEATLLNRADEYEAEIERAYRQSGLPEAEQAEEDAYQAADKLAARTAAHQAHTLLGLEIKARAARSFTASLADTSSRLAKTIGGIATDAIRIRMSAVQS